LEESQTGREVNNYTLGQYQNIYLHSCIASEWRQFSNEYFILKNITVITGPLRAGGPW